MLEDLKSRPVDGKFALYNEVRRVIRNKKMEIRPEGMGSKIEVKNNDDHSHSNDEGSCTSAHLRARKKKAEILRYRLEGMEVDKFEEKTRKAKERLIKKMVSDNRFKTASLDQIFGTSRNRNKGKLAEYFFSH